MSGFGKQYTVKVQNLSKSTSIYRIQDKIRITSPDDIFVKDCPDALANYAYVNCSDLATAQSVVNRLHHTTLDNNKIVAKIKGEEYSSGGSDHQLYPTCSTRGHNSYGAFNRPPSHELRIERCSRSRSRSPIFSRSRWDVDSSDTSKLCRLAKRSGLYSTSDDSRRREAGPGTSCDPSALTSSGEKTIKVTIHGSGVTSVDLDHYFSMYGPLATETIVRPGQPNYSYVNFKRSEAAKAACITLEHNIKGTIVVAVLKSSKGATPIVHCLGPQASSEALPCNPLVIEKAHEQMSQELDSKLIKIIPVDDRIVVHVPQKIAKSVTGHFRKVIEAQEAKITSTEILLNFCFYPVLASKLLGQKLLELEKKFDLKVEHNGEKVSLEEFREKWKTIAGDLAPQISQPQTSSASETTYQWCWFNDDKYQPYSSTTNEKIEEAFQSQTSISISIGEHDYVIDTASKQQTNQATKKTRNIQRRKLHCAQNSNVMLHLTSHEDYIQEVRNSIMEKLESRIHEKKVHLPDSVQSLDQFVGVLLTSASRNFVHALVDEDGASVVIRGTGTRIDQSKLEMLRRILGKERELGRTTSLRWPDSWVPQGDNCELKLVSVTSPEWVYVEKRFLQPNFNVQITKIERIQNKWLWEAYVQARDRMSSKNGEHGEKMLFHGTRKTPPKDIYNSEQGFDSRLASKGLYGEGAYFAKNSSYSDGYAHEQANGRKQMFLARVITGMPYECHNHGSTLKAPPLKRAHGSSLDSLGRCKFEGERYDSVTAVTNGSRIYVIYELGRVYPDYLITYESQTPKIFNFTQYHKGFSL